MGTTPHSWWPSTNGRARYDGRPTAGSRRIRRIPRRSSSGSARDQVVSVGAFRAAAYDPATGREIWRVSYADGFSNVPRPVYGHGLVYIATGFQQPALIAVRADGTGDVTRTHVAWTLRRGAPLTPSPLLVGDELYVVTDGGIATCLDARTGTVHWQMRLGWHLCGIAGLCRWPHLFSRRTRRGDGDAPGRAFRRVGSSTLDGAMLASMAVARGSLFISSFDTIVTCIASRPLRMSRRAAAN